MTIDSTYEYELIDISFEHPYEHLEGQSQMVHEDEIADVQPSATEIEYDAEGIPMGHSKVEIKMRRQLIESYLLQWGKDNSERKIFNEALQDYIYVKGISVIEAKEHSAKSYLSTRAVLILGEVLSNAMPVRRTPVKVGNQNQSQFAYMLVMVYRHAEIGTIKLTVGVKSSDQRIEYGITSLPPNQPLIGNKKKKRNP